MKVRDKSLDTVCGIMILWMIFTHICLQTHVANSLIYKCLNRMLFFFMPWFFFKSGMFFRPLPLREELSKSWKRLGIPFIVFSLIGVIFALLDQAPFNSVSSFMNYLIAELVKNGAVNINIVLWYLSALILIRLVNNRINFAPPTIFLLSIICIMIACYFSMKQFDFSYMLPVFFSGSFFFMSGRLLKDIQYERRIYIFAFAVFIVCILFVFSNVNMRRNVLTQGYYLIWAISSLGGIITINNLLKRYPLKWLPFHKIGENSMSYFVTHILLMYILTAFMNYVGIANTPTKIILYAIWLALTLPVVNRILNHRKLKWMIGK